MGACSPKYTLSATEKIGNGKILGQKSYYYLSTQDENRGDENQIVEIERSNNKINTVRKRLAKRKTSDEKKIEKK